MSEIKIYTQHEVAKQLDGLYVTLADHEAAMVNEAKAYKVSMTENALLKAENERLMRDNKALREMVSVLDRVLAERDEVGDE